MLLIIYATIFKATPTSDGTATRYTIHRQIDELESANPDSTLIALSDLNHVEINLPNYTQQISCTTRANNNLDKCCLKYKNAYKCHKLAQLGNSDHHPMFLLPKSLENKAPKSSSKINVETGALQILTNLSVP